MGRGKKRGTRGWEQDTDCVLHREDAQGLPSPHGGKLGVNARRVPLPGAAPGEPTWSASVSLEHLRGSFQISRAPRQRALPEQGGRARGVFDGKPAAPAAAGAEAARRQRPLAPSHGASLKCSFPPCVKAVVPQLYLEIHSWRPSSLYASKFENDAQNA